MTGRSCLWFVVVGASLLVVVLFLLPPRSTCSGVPREERGEHWFQATDTVVKPWFGRHHVYGIFAVPDQYKFDHLYTAKLVIHGVQSELLAGSPEYTDIPSSTWEAGSYRKRVYLSTRATLKFIAMGRFGDLTMPCHWWLVIRDRTA
ncbi:MAG: hypothetical protein AB7P24_20040 [Nitrospira sp.]